MEEKKELTPEELVDEDFAETEEEDVENLDASEDEDLVDNETEETEETEKGDEKDTKKETKETKDNSKSTKDEEKSKSKQSRKENARYAEMRRKYAELERENKELKKQVSNSEFNGRIKNISEDTLDALGLTSIEDEDDLFRCETYEKAIKSNADDPLREVERAYAKKVKEEKRKLVQERETQEKNEKLLREDQIEFKKKFGVDTSVAVNDEKFMALFSDQITYGNLTELYSRYVQVFGKQAREDDEKSKAMGKIPSSNSKPQPKSQNINDIQSDEDFLKAFDALYHNKY